MAATARRLVASSIPYLNRMKRVQFQVTLPIALHHSVSRRNFSVACPEQSGLFQSGKSSLTPIHLLLGKKERRELKSKKLLSCELSSNIALFRDGSGPCSDKFHKWHNGGGTLHESASIDSSAVVEIGVVVHSKAVVGANVHIGSGTIVGTSVTIGHSTKIGYNVALSNCQVGELCVFHNGVCIGQDGFGFYVEGNGNMIKKPQMLNVIIGAHVEIGANTCIDRGSWRDTIIGDYTKLDNLVQIGHNVFIGKNCMICGQVGIAGSATIGDYVTMGGRVAVRDHVSIVSKVRLAATSCVTTDIQEPGDYGGFPAVPIHKWRRQIVSSCRTTRKRSP